jgi:hypothetical protein
MNDFMSVAEYPQTERSGVPTGDERKERRMVNEIMELLVTHYVGG